jgi:ribonuclease BN (tRNA processing enzyme)
MFALTFLGTSASDPSADRNHPGILIEAGSHRILVDCGGGDSGSCCAAVPASDVSAVSC